WSRPSTWPRCGPCWPAGWVGRWPWSSSGPRPAAPPGGRRGGAGPGGGGGGGGGVAGVLPGPPPRRASGMSIAGGLAAVGVPVKRIDQASLDARGSTPYFADARDGRRLFVKALGRDERSADLLFRFYRWLVPRDLGDEKGYRSLRRAVEHEALVALAARDLGVRTPRFVSLATADPNSFVLVYEGIDGKSRARAPPRGGRRRPAPGHLGPGPAAAGPAPGAPGPAARQRVHGRRPRRVDDRLRLSRAWGPPPAAWQPPGPPRG